MNDRNILKNKKHIDKYWEGEIDSEELMRQLVNNGCRRPAIIVEKVVEAQVQNRNKPEVAEEILTEYKKYFGHRLGVEVQR